MGSLRMDENSELSARRLPGTVSQKLWEGSLQLGSSVTVSTVAFFKSGERIPDVNWAKSVEVKGKVRLKAFEKYIQDLPRSRTRGLMVISLCWDSGSSETGRNGMKEVGQKYQERDKVGLAQLSEGVDLYICPRSNSIITILAKYGFFKGSAAIEDNQDALIGCVVWRKSYPPKAASKASDGNILKPRPVTDEVGSQFPQSTDLSVSIPQSAQNLREDASGAGCATEKNVGKQSESSTKGAKSTTTSKGSPASAPKNMFSTSLGHQTFPACNSDTDIQSPITEHLKDSLGLEKPILSTGSDAVQPAVSDDDDLPEFDFKIAQKVLQNQEKRGSDAPVVDKSSASEVGQKVDSSLPDLLRILVGMTSPNRGSQTSNIRGNPPDASHAMLPSKRAREYETQLPLPKREEMTSSATLSGREKNLFDDDDDDNDMPEWQPPAHGLRKDSAVSTTKPLLGLIPTALISALGNSKLVFPQSKNASAASVYPPLPLDPHPLASTDASAAAVRPPFPVNAHLPVVSVHPPLPLLARPVTSTDSSVAAVYPPLPPHARPVTSTDSSSAAVRPPLPPSVRPLASTESYAAAPVHPPLPIQARPLRSFCPINTTVNSAQPWPSVGLMQRQTHPSVGSSTKPMWTPPRAPPDFRPIHSPAWTQKKP